MIDLQRAENSKRIFAFLTDLILMSILTAGIYLLLSWMLNVDSYSEKYDGIKEEYEQLYNVKFGLSQEEYDKLEQSEKNNYKAAVDAMNSDEEASSAIKKSYSLSIGIFLGGIIVSFVVFGFIVPLILKEGRTAGKRLFGLAVIRSGFTHASPVVIFTRNVIGTGVFEIILPIMIFLSSLMNLTGVFGIILLVIFIAAELIVFAKSSGHRLLHDVLADTVVVDWASQRVFDTPEERDRFIEEEKSRREESRLY